MDVFKINKDLLVDSSAGEGRAPKKCVRTIADIPQWQRSKAHHDLVGFINGISVSIQGKRINAEIHISENMQNLLDIFDVLSKYVDENPPLEQAYRFGNKAYRSWSRRANQDIFLLLQKAIPEEKCELVSELGTYLAESFGNATRIDYGTGHELSFIFFLCALFKGEILVEEDNVACALRLFNKYLLFVRRLQTTYRMEPAGSQGVWSLDDFQFVPFLWGSAQLSCDAPFEPPKFLDEDIINEYKDDYMFIGCIDYIRKVKTGHFAEHSNQLWSISAVPTWPKITIGLLRMYAKEILSKFPIIQHVYFGTLMSYESEKPGTALKMPRLGFVQQTGGDEMSVGTPAKTSKIMETKVEITAQSTATAEMVTTVTATVVTADDSENPESTEESQTSAEDPAN